ncbi:MAG: hypothetical protein P8I94_06160 [Emcibacteraceae bacterium]|nr:hypothetical protein [Emcibacteraceae bacterium]
MIDPNAKLSRQHYTEGDYIDVLSSGYYPTKNNGILVVHKLANGEEAKQFFSPFGGNRVALRIWKATFVDVHIMKEHRAAFNRMKSADQICKSPLIRNPIKITHRLNDKGKSVINRKRFKE